MSVKNARFAGNAYRFGERNNRKCSIRKNALSKSVFSLPADIDFNTRYGIIEIGFGRVLHEPRRRLFLGDSYYPPGLVGGASGFRRRDHLVLLS